MRRGGWSGGWKAGEDGVSARVVRVQRRDGLKLHCQLYIYQYMDEHCAVEALKKNDGVTMYLVLNKYQIPGTQVVYVCQYVRYIISCQHAVNPIN